MGAPSAALYIYDPVSDSWTSGASMPAARTTASGGVVNGRFYVTGGSSTTGTDNPLVIYDPRSNRWLTSAPEPTPRFLGAAAGVGPQLFVAGGYNDNVPTSIAEVFAR
jgi:N-acetylneuraminic acid mutarotase